MDLLKELLALNATPKEEPQEVVVEGKTDKAEIYYSAKAMGQLGDIYTIDATANVTKLAEALGIKDGWKTPVKIGNLYASLNSGDRLAFFTNKNDYDPDEMD